MKRGRILLAVAATLAAFAAPAAAQHPGEFPISTRVAARIGNDTDLYAGLTFGMLLSFDDGAHVYYTCEENVGFAGTFDPKYRIAADGTIYATTIDGVRVSTDGGCSFRTITDGTGTGELEGVWTDAIDVAPDGTLWIGTTETGAANGIYRSTDRGQTVEPMGLETKTAWWKTLHIAPSDPQRIYVAGYQVAPTKSVYVYRSDNGGQSWMSLPTTDFLLGLDPEVHIEGVDPTDANILYARSIKAFAPAGDRLYRSADGGMTWTGVLDTEAALNAVVVRGNGEVLAGTTVSTDPVAGCSYRSSGRGTTFTACELGPVMECVTERSDGELFACGANWDPDFFTVGRSTDGVAWTPVLRFHEMTGPLDCPAGTTSYDVCTLQVWPGVAERFGVLDPDAGPVEPTPPPPPDGCCDSGGGSPTSLVLVLLVAVLLFRRQSASRQDG